MIPPSRIVSLLALGAICLAGCSSEEPAQQQLKPLTLLEQASNVIKSGDAYAVTWSAVLANGNPWHFGEHVVATVVGKDAGGREVFRMDQPLDAVPPGGSLAFTGETTATAKPAKVDVVHRPAQWRQASRVPSAFRPFPVSRVQTLRQKDGSYVITGYVANPYQLPASSLVVSALLRDAAGKLLGGASTFVDDVQAGRPPRFIMTATGLPKGSSVARTEVTAHTWGSTARPYEELAMGGAVPVHTVKPTTEPFQTDRGSELLSDSAE